MSLDIELDHIGVAVKSLSQSPFFKLLGLEFSGLEEVPSEKLKVAFFKTLNGANIELIEPTEADSPVGRFLEKRGPGIHHICFRVKNIDQTVERLKKENIQLVTEKPVQGAGNCRIIFIHPRSTGGVLVELSQKGG